MLFTMKSNDISKFVFINPSPNLYKISRFVKSFGKDVDYIYTKDFINLNSEKIFYMTPRNILKFDLTMLEKSVDDKGIYSYKKRFFLKKHVKKCLEVLDNNDPYMSCANYVDFQIISRQRIKEYSAGHGKTNYMDYASLKKRFVENDCYYIAGWMPEDVKSRDLSKFFLFIFETDIDLEKCFGSDFFVVFFENVRFEIATLNGRLYILSTQNKNVLEKLKNKFTFMNKFTFKKVSEKTVTKNCNPWFVKGEKKNLTIVNDYSFFNISIKLPEDWYTGAGRYLCTEMQL